MWPSGAKSHGHNQCSEISPVLGWTIVLCYEVSVQGLEACALGARRYDDCHVWSSYTTILETVEEDQQADIHTHPKLLAAGWLAGSILEERYGLGRDIWTLEPWRISEFLKVFFVFEVFYTLTLGLIKTSILFLYLRLFLDPKFRRTVWATQAFNFLLVGSFIISDFLQCQPISFFWTSWDGEHSGRCFNINALAWAHSALNIALDFWMLYLPATQVWSLQMKVKKKIGVILMFGIGILWVPCYYLRITDVYNTWQTRGS